MTNPEISQDDLQIPRNVRWSKKLLMHEKQKHDFFETKIAHPSREASKQEINNSAVGERDKRGI